jgi:hypothetical protein
MQSQTIEADPDKAELTSNDTQIALAKLKYDYDLACLGLQGTLMGAAASLVAIVTIVVAQVATERYVVQGWAFTTMVGVLATAVTAYGVFIFRAAFSVAMKTKGFETSLGAKGSSERA